MATYQGLIEKFLMAVEMWPSLKGKFSMELKSLSKKQLNSLLDSTLKSLQVFHQCKEDLLKLTGSPEVGDLSNDGEFNQDLFRYQSKIAVQSARRKAVDRLHETQKLIEEYSQKAADIRARIHELDWKINPNLLAAK